MTHNLRRTFGIAFVGCAPESCEKLWRLNASKVRNALELLPDRTKLKGQRQELVNYGTIAVPRVAPFTVFYLMTANSTSRCEEITWDVNDKVRAASREVGVARVGYARR